MDDRQFQEWVDRNEEFQREQAATERRHEYMERIIATSRGQRSEVIEFIRKRVEKDRKRGVSDDESLREFPERAELLKDDLL